MEQQIILSIHAEGSRKGKSIYRLNGTWHETEDVQFSLARTSDPVPRDELPGGWNDKYLFIRGYQYPISKAVAETVKAAGFGRFLSREAVAPTVVVEHHEEPQQLQMGGLNKLARDHEARLAHLEAVQKGILVQLQRLQRALEKKKEVANASG